MPVTSTQLHCRLLGLGAWGPGFANWEQLREHLLAPESATALPPATNPSPQVIPANERRRAPLPVKMAVEVSGQALAASGLASADVACVFGSGLGDTEITDYMCRELTTELKQLSPTKFHNSVHNAAAGYWTISTGCMKSANSIAAYQQTAALALLEGAIQCVQQNEPVLITLFDTPAHASYRQIFDCDQPFAAALLICPADYAANGPLLTFDTDAQGTPPEGIPQHPELAALYQQNPAARVLGLLNLIAAAKTGSSIGLTLSTGRQLGISLEANA